MRKVALSACSIVALVFATSAVADTAATINVENKTNSYINVSIDGGGYFCSTAQHSNCSRPFPTGHHSLRAVRTDNNAATETEFDLDAQGYDWVPFPEEQPQ